MPTMTLQGSAMLCETCAGINWAHVLGGTLTDDARRAFSERHMYNLDGIGGTGAAFLRGPIPSIADMVETPRPCPLCRLWLRAYERVYPEDDPAKDGRGKKDSWFTYYVGGSGYGNAWLGNPRGIDDDYRGSQNRQKAMAAFRLRFRSYESMDDFERLLELTCLDSDLPPRNRSRGGRLIQDSCARNGLFKDWLQLCQTDHGAKCSWPLSQAHLREVADTTKFRLIDVDKLSVVVCSFEQRYCALSYVWGSSACFTAHPNFFEPDVERPGELLLDLKSFLPGSNDGLMPFTSDRGSSETVARTIFDAIQVTKALGERYLWVDAICIMQEAKEMANSISNMDIIYKNAVITIVAAAGSDCAAGLPRAHPNAPSLVQISEKVGDRTFMLAQPSLDLVLKDSAWASRAWTFQEGKLSSRHLFFTKYGIYFRCQTDTWAEDSIEKTSTAPVTAPSTAPVTQSSRRPIGRRQTVMYMPFNTPENEKEARFADYTYDVRLYTARTLSYAGDALNAFTGLLSDFRRTTMATEFYWGLPQCYFDAALLWKCVELWDYNLWAYRPPDEPVFLHDASPEQIESMRQNNLRRAAIGFTLPPYEEKPFTRVVRRSGFPSWSWCGRHGHVGYFPRKVASPDLHLLQSVLSSVEWPWDAHPTHHLPNYRQKLQQGVLTFYAWRAMVDFERLPYGVSTEDSRIYWPGWPMDDEPPLRHGLHECVLLSTQFKHPIPWSGLRFERNLTLRPVGDVPLVNVMVLGRDHNGRHFRRGIGMMREDVWMGFECTWELIELS